MQQMLVAIPFHTADLRLVKDLLEWIKMLGGCPRHDCVLVADAAVEWGPAMDLLTFANTTFRSCKLITNDRPVDGWIEGANSLFMAAMLHVEPLGAPFLWLEPDATPLKPNWMDTIATVYEQAGKPFMGQLYLHEHPEPPMAPYPLMSGVAVYPADAFQRLGRAVKFAPNLAFDVSVAAITSDDGANTKLIQHFQGEKGLPPTFAETKTETSPRNTFTLDRLHPDAVIFHRCKDGSLIRLLRRKLFPHIMDRNRFVTVFPFCQKDAALLTKNLGWMLDLGGCPKDSAILAFEKTMNPGTISQIQNLARGVFAEVADFRYPPSAMASFPATANHAFRCVSVFMQPLHRSWLWFEPDMVPCRRGWLDALQTAYGQSRHPFFGPVVPQMGHFNGTAIYPSDTPSRCPSLARDDMAFDMAIRDDVKGQVTDASNIIQHAWVMVGGRMQPHGAGELPQFRTIADVKRMLLPSAALFHRDKTLSLIDRLREMKVA